ncbi:hypothetical protein ACVWYH_005953 [Bradyrhizobium sp. GM24.11]
MTLSGRRFSAPTFVGFGIFPSASHLAKVLGAG